MVPSDGIVRLAAAADMHCTTASRGSLKSLFTSIGDHADVFLLCGDVTETGEPEEARVFVEEMAETLRIPVVGVLGNHDFESGKEEELKAILSGGGVHLLDGSTVEIRGIGFAGVKGFAGGFDHRALQPWGETSIKRFVREAADEATKLESALMKIRAPWRVALLHYAPVRSTVAGENEEIYPFLGSSRLEDALNRGGATVVFHGHAHGGSPEGKTRGGIPVYNVSRQLLARTWPDRPAYRLFEVRAAELKDSHAG